MRRLKASGVRCVLLSVLGLVLAATEARSSPYSITGLGTLPGTSQSVAMAINNQGQVAGISYNSGDGTFGKLDYEGSYSDVTPARFHAVGDGAQSFLYSNGGMTQISPNGGLATSINDSGQAVGGPNTSINNAGRYVAAPGSRIDYGFNAGPSLLVDGDKTTNLGLFTPYAINNAGQIAGYQINPWGTADNAGVYQNGAFKDLTPSLKNQGFDGYDSRAVAINSMGDMVVNAINQDLSLHSYFYRASSGALTELTKLPGGSGMVATALNDKDQAVGNGFLYSDGTIQSLPSLLPTNSGWSNLNATGINNAGQIVGQGQYNGQEQAFLMNPDGFQTVPEPSTLALGD